MAEDSKRLRILSALRTRVEAITTANGFRTNAGQRIYIGEIPSLGPHDPDVAIAILPQEDSVEAAIAKVPIAWPIDIVGLVKASITNCWLEVEDILADIKEAVELDDRTLDGLLKGGNNNPGGLVRGTTAPFHRTSGSDVVGAAITYVAPLAESWGRPEL